MNWERIEANWKQFRGAAKAHWIKLTDAHLDLIGGRRDVLAGKIQEMYGTSADETERQVAAWAKALGPRSSALRKRP